MFTPLRPTDHLRVERRVMGKKAGKGIKEKEEIYIFELYEIMESLLQFVNLC